MSFIKNSKINLGCYVALGDSVTAGYADGALFYEGQQHAYPNILATQFQTLKPTRFKQPLVNPASVGIGFFGNSRLVLRNEKNCFGKDILSPVFLAPKGDLKSFANNLYFSDGPFNNMGIPGAKTISVIAPGYGNHENGAGNFNPFFTRLSSNPLTSSILSDALLMRPTFFTLFIGNNDVLAYALSGGTTDAITPLAGPPGIGFEASLRTIINELLEQGANGVIATIPYINNIPYFTTIPYNGMWLNEEQIVKLKTIYSTENFQFNSGNNPFIVEDSIGTKTFLRFAEKDDLILGDLLLDENRCAYQSGEKPVPKKYLLTKAETNKVLQAIEAYNTCITAIAHEKGLGLADVSSFVKALKPDRKYNSQLGMIEFDNNCIFSLDGVHLCDAGQFMLANVFMKSINDSFSK